jgi:hypothetical protein
MQLFQPFSFDAQTARNKLATLFELQEEWQLFPGRGAYQPACTVAREGSPQSQTQMRRDLFCAYRPSLPRGVGLRSSPGRNGFSRVGHQL